MPTHDPHQVPEQLPPGDTQEAPDPAHKPMEEDHQDLADLDKFMPGASPPPAHDHAVDPGYYPHEGDIASGESVPADRAPPKTRMPGEPFKNG